MNAKCRGATAKIEYGAIFGAAKRYFWSTKIQIRSRLPEKKEKEIMYKTFNIP